MKVRTAKKVGVGIILGVCGFLTIVGFATNYLAGLFFVSLTCVVLIIILVATKPKTTSLPSVPSMEKTHYQGYEDNQETRSSTHEDLLNLSDFSNLTWEDMEHLVGRLFEKKGYEVKVTQKTGDSGIDVWAEKDGIKIGIQVKHWNANVGVVEATQTVGAGRGIAHKCILISTKSFFTPQALEYEREHSHDIELWDTHRFKKELAAVGISTLSSSTIQPISSDEKATHNISESKQTISKSAQVSIFFFMTGITILIFSDFYPNTWFVSIPLIAIAILIPLVKFMWKVAGFAADKVEELK